MECHRCDGKIEEDKMTEYIGYCECGCGRMYKKYIYITLHTGSLLYTNKKVNAQ